MTSKPAAILAATLVPGNAAYERLKKPKREKLAKLAALFASTDHIGQGKLFAAIAPKAKPESQVTTLKRLQDTLQAFAADAKLLLRLALASDGTASLEASAEPSPVEKLAASMLPLDTRGLTQPRIAAPRDLCVFVSLAHDEEQKDKAQMALIASIEKRTQLLARQTGKLGKVAFFRDPQIALSDSGITHRVTEEMAKADAFVILLWQRYLERVSDASSGFNVIRDVEHPFMRQHPTKRVVAAYGSLSGLTGLREKYFSDKPIGDYNSPVQYEKDEAKRESFVNNIADAVIEILTRPEPPPRALPDEDSPDDHTGAGDDVTSARNKSRRSEHDLNARASALAPDVENSFAPPRARTGTLSRDESDTAPADAGGKDLLPELHAWVGNPGASPFCAVLGETGQGKTTAMQMFARELLKARERKTTGKKPPLPIYIDLRKYPYNADDSIETLLTRVLSESGEVGAATPKALQEMLAALHRGELVVIFDGLDERTVGMTRQEATHFIQQLWRIFPNDGLHAWREYFAARAKFRDEVKRQSEASEKAGVSTGHKVLQGPKPPPPMGKMLLTCRTHYFRTLAEMNGMLLDNLRGDAEAADFSLYRLLPFNEEQIRHYLKAKLPTRDPDAVIALFCRVHNLRELAARPLLLRMITDRIDRIEQIVATAGQEFLTLHLYRDIVSDWLTRDDPKHKFASEYKPLLMESLACELWKKRARTISVEKLAAWLDTFLAAHPHIENAHNRIDRELLKEDLRTATFIVHSQRSGNTSEYSFAHTSFLEYFLASAIGRQLASGALDKSLFKVAPPSLEAARFLAEWRVAADEDDGQAFDEALAAQLGVHSPAINGWLFLVYQHLHSLGIDVHLPAPLCLRDADLTGSAIRGLPHRWLNLRDTDFSGATLTESDWAFADARGAKFTGAWVGGASFEAAHISPNALDAAAWLGGMRMRHPVAARSAFDATRPRALQPRFSGGHDEVVHHVAIDVSHAYIVSASADNIVKLWSVSTGACVQTFVEHQGRVLCTKFDTSGAVFATSCDDQTTIKLWSFAKGACVRIFSGHQSRVRSAAFDSSGAFIVSTSHDKTVKLWNIASGTCVRTFGHQESVWCAAVDESGTFIVSSSDDKALKLWNIASGACVQTLSVPEHTVSCVAADARRGYFASTAVDNAIKLWSMATGECVQTLSGHQSIVRNMAIDASGSFIVSVSTDSTIKLWDVVTGSCVQTFAGHVSEVFNAAFDCSGALIVSSSTDKTVKLWSRASGACIQTLSGGERWMQDASFDASGTVIALACGDNTVKLWNIASGVRMRTFTGHQHWPWSVAFDASGNFLVSASQDKTVKLWSVATGACLKTLSGHQSPVRSASFDRIGEFIVSSSDDKTIKIWDVATGTCVQTISGHDAPVQSASFDSTGAVVVSASDDKSVKLWDVATRACVQTFYGHDAPVQCAAFDATGAYIVSASNDKTVKLWSVATGACLKTFFGHVAGVRSVAFDATGTFIVSASQDTTVKLWQVATGVCAQTLFGHKQRIWRAAFDTSGAFAVSASDDGTVRMWDLKTGTCVRIFAQLPQRQWATLDVATKRFIAASPGAWRYIGYVDENGHEIEAESLGAITGMEWPVDMRVPA